MKGIFFILRYFIFLVILFTTYWFVEGDFFSQTQAQWVTTKQTLLYQDKLDNFLSKVKASQSNMTNTSYVELLLQLNQKMTALKEKYNSNTILIEMLNYLIQWITQLQKEAMGNDDFFALICGEDEKCLTAATATTTTVPTTTILTCKKDVVSSLKMSDWSWQVTGFYWQPASDVSLWLRWEPKNSHPYGTTSSNMWKIMALNAWAQELNTNNLSWINWKEIMKNTPYFSDTKVSSAIHDAYELWFKMDQNSWLDPNYDWVWAMTHLLQNSLITQDIELWLSKKCETLQKTNSGIACDFKDWKTKINYGCMDIKKSSSWTTTISSEINKESVQCKYANNTSSVWTSFNRPGLSLKWGLEKSQTQKTHSYSFQLTKQYFPIGAEIRWNNWSDGTFQYNSREVVISECPNDFDIVPSWNNFENCAEEGMFWRIALWYLGDSETQSKTTCNLVPGKTYYLNIRNIYNQNEWAYLSSGYLYDTLWINQKSNSTNTSNISTSTNIMTQKQSQTQTIETQQSTQTSQINPTIPAYCGPWLIAPSDKLCTGNWLNDPCLSSQHWKNKLTLRDCESVVKKGWYSVDAYDKFNYCPVNAQNIVTTLYIWWDVYYTWGASQEIQSKCSAYMRDQQAKIWTSCSVEWYQVSNASGELICRWGKYKFNCNKYYDMPTPRPPYESVCWIESQNDHTTVNTTNVNTSSNTSWIPTCNNPEEYYYYYNPDVKNAWVDAKQHWTTHGKDEKRKSCW